VEDSSTRYADVISDKERKIIYSVLSQYNFEISNCTKVGNVYKIETSEGRLCLNKIRHGRHKPNNGCIIVQELMEKGFYNMAKYYKPKGKKSYVKSKKLLFYVTDWIDGKQCNLNDAEEVILSIKSLAQFHIAINSIDKSNLKLKSNLKNWPQIFTENLRHLEKYERIINAKRIKSEFDLSYYDFIQSMYDRGMVALNLLNSAGYYKLSKHTNRNKILCQNIFYCQNIIKKDDIYYIIDIGNIIIDLQVADLAKVLCRLMFKRNYKWDFNKAKMLIDSYISINKLDKNELEVMLALIIFPYKFCKIGKKRYIKHKAWDESKYMHKLTKLIKYDELQNKFLEDYLSNLNELY